MCFNFTPAGIVSFWFWKSHLIIKECAYRLCLLGLSFVSLLLDNSCLDVAYYSSVQAFILLSSVCANSINSSASLFSTSALPLPGLSIIPFSDIMPHPPGSLLSLKLNQFLLTAFNVSHDSLSQCLSDSHSPLFLFYNREMPTAPLSIRLWVFYLQSLSSLSTLILSSFFAEEVHHVSVSINTSHSTLVCGEAWGTDPHFSWLHERAAITNSVGRVSKDGTTLLVTKIPICGHFTCMVSNELGHSSATYTAGTSVSLVCTFSDIILPCFGLNYFINIIRKCSLGVTTKTDCSFSLRSRSIF